MAKRWHLLFLVLAFVFDYQNSWAGQKICLTMIFPSSDLSGVQADRNHYKKIAEANDCRHIEISKDFFIKNAPKEKALKMLKEQLGDSSDVLLMYSGHGVCIGDYTAQSYNPGKTRGYKYRMAPVVGNVSTATVLKDNGLHSFGMVYGDYDACLFKCEGELYKVCRRNCMLNHSIHDEDLATLFEGKNLTSIIDACGSGCQNADFLRVKQLNSFTSAASAESTLDTQDGGILNVRLKEAYRSGEVCHMDVNSDGKISFSELGRYMSSAANQAIPKSFEGDDNLKGTKAISPRSQGGGSSSFNLGTYSRAGLCDRNTGGSREYGGVK